MDKTEAQLQIAAELLAACDIDANQYLALTLHSQGFGSREIGFMMRRGKSTINRWLQNTLEKIDRRKGEGEVRAGVTIHRPSSEETETPFIRDMCLQALGF